MPLGQVGETSKNRVYTDEVKPLYKDDPAGYQRIYRQENAARIKKLKHEWYKRNTEHVLAQAKAWHDAHPETIRETKRRHRHRLSAIVATAKAGKPCKDCGVIKRPQQMHYDHVRGVKKFNIGGPEAHYVSAAVLRAEIRKCVIRCDSCHIKRHWRKRKKLTNKTKPA